MTTFNIPKATLRPNQPRIGPYSVAAGMYSFTVDVVISQPTGAGTSFAFDLQGSTDGGATWESLGGILPIVGGFTFTAAAPLHYDTAFWLGSPDAPVPDRGRHGAMQLQIVVTVVGANVSVTSGTLVVN